MKKTLIIVVLVAIIGFLTWWLIGGFRTPIEFEKVRKAREEVVVERLKDIRTAQRAYRTKYKQFAPTMDTLITFVQSDSLEVMMIIGQEVEGEEDKVIREVRMIAVKDTIFNARLRKNPDFKIEDMRYIPFSDVATGSFKEFRFGAKILETESGVKVPVFEAFAPYMTFLGDLDKQHLINFRDEQINTLNKADGLMVGSLERTNNEAGNWE